MIELQIEVAKVSQAIGYTNVRTFYTTTSRMSNKLGVKFRKFSARDCRVASGGGDGEWEDVVEGEEVGVEDVEMDFSGGLTVVKQ
jgi:hypothetical protein